MSVIKLIIYGFYLEGIKVLIKSILKNWFNVCIILLLLIYLCSNQKTYFVSWTLIGLFALFAVIKAVYEIFLLLIKYRKTNVIQKRDKIILLIGGRIFDIVISTVGILQAGKIIRHSVKLANAASSAFSLVDDVVAAISNVTKNFFK